MDGTLTAHRAVRPRIRTFRTFRAMNTDWWIQAADADPMLLDRMEGVVRNAEERYSRFRPASLLSRLNEVRRLEDEDVARLVRRALEIGRLTGGAFDIRIGPALAAAGYDRSFELLPPMLVEHRLAPSVALLSVGVEDAVVTLEGVGAIDLGGIAKGWTIDRVAEALEREGVTDYLIDGGGDIRASGVASDGEPWLVGAGVGLAVRLADASVCTSSTMRRRWATAGGDAHHIISPWSGQPTVEEVTSVVVVGVDAATADALATAVLAAPSVLGTAAGLGAEILLERGGAWEMTPGMEGWIA